MPRSKVSPLTAKSFPMLVHRLAEEQHNSVLLAMSQAVEIPYTTLWRWERNMTRQYDYTLVQQLGKYYGLPVDQLHALIYRDTDRRARGQKIPMPNLSFRKRGPAAGKSRTTRRHGDGSR